MSGEQAAKLFYDHDKFTGKGALPKRVQKTLTGENGVQMTNESEHKHRKQMFMSLMSEERLKVLVDITKEEWKKSTIRWNHSKELVLFDEVQEIMVKIACRWAGVPLKEDEIREKADDFGSMIDDFGGIGLRYWKGKLARCRAEKWIQEFISEVRKEKIKVEQDTAAYVISFHHTLDEKLLDLKVAAVDLINILRPIVAIATDITFGALAMHQNPECKSKLKKQDEDYAEMFVQEVRRYYPFAPFVGARVKEDFSWSNYLFKKGTLVLLDIYGTNHDATYWDHPDEFQPTRFRNWDKNPFSFIPQGGGDYDTNHRCAGEWVTIEVMKSSLLFMANHLEYEVPVQNLNYSLVRIPTLPKDRMIIKDIRVNI